MSLPAAMHALQRDELFALIERAVAAGALTGGEEDVAWARRAAAALRVDEAWERRAEALARSQAAARAASEAGHAHGFASPECRRLAREADALHGFFRTADRQWVRRKLQWTQAQRALDALRRKVAA